MGAVFSAPVQTGPGAHPASCTMGTGSFPGVKSSRGVTLTPHPLLVPWSRKGRAIPLLPLWAVRPVQSLSACTRVHFTFTLYCDYSALPVKYWASHVVCSPCVLRCKFSAQLIKCVTNQIKCSSPSFTQFNAFFKTQVWIFVSTTFPLLTFLTA